MSKRSAKSQASSARAATSAFGSAFGSSSTPAFGASSSQLSHVTEPPDLSTISDPNVVVYFRNLSKKDSTTKARALEDLQAYVARLEEPVEEGLLEAWIKMYPRASIDNGRLVRNNAHALQGQLAAAAGKRFAKHMPKSVGAWLCGLYDSDRSVVDATQNSLRQVFNTPEKIQNIRRAYQQPILEYCRDAIDKETSLTLSDERTVSPDDAEAKYSRVISACISLLGSLLANLKPEELSKHQAEYDSLLDDKKLWEFASHGDASVRRSMHRLLRTCLEKQPEAVRSHLQAISKAYLSSGLDSDQIGSSLDYVDTLALLTAAYPTVWTDDYKSKTSADRRLRQFLRKGSQSGPRQFWDRLTSLLDAIPKDLLSTNVADAIKLLSAIHDGIARRDESRVNQESAYKAYLAAVTSLCTRLSNEDQIKLLEELLLPLVAQYLRPSPDTSDWNIPPNSTHLIAKSMTIGTMPAILESTWPNYADQFINDIKVSAPEQSKDHEKSQNALIQQSSRFASLQKQALRADDSKQLRLVFEKSSTSITREALTVISNRNGKPYGAAGAVAELLHHNQELVFANSDIANDLEIFVGSEIPRLVLSPSSSYLVDVLYSLSEYPSFGPAWAATLKVILEGPESPRKTKALESLLTSSRVPKSFDLASTDEALQGYIKSSVQDALNGSTEWDAFHRILQSPAKILAADTTDEILSYMTHSLSLAQQAPYALQGLRQIVKQNPSILKDFLSTQQGSSLLQSLLLASESGDETISQDAAAVNASIQTVLTAGTDTKQSVYGLVQQGLREATQTSVSVETLVDLAKQLVKPGSSWEDMVGVFPSTEDWNEALSPFLETAPKTSLAIVNPLGGAVYLVKDESKTLKKKVSRDSDGYSSAYRITQYVTRLFKESDYFPVERIPSDLRHVFLRNIALTIQLADDNLGLAGANSLWAEYNPDVEADAISFMADAQSFVTQELKQLQETWSSDVNTSLLAWAAELLSKIEPEASPGSYYSARAYSVLVADAIEICGWKNSETAQVQEMLKTIRRSKELFPLLGFINSFKEPFAASKSCERMCNELIADLTGLNLEEKPERGLEQLVLLNALLYGQEDIAQSVAKQRIIFFIKHAIFWLEDTKHFIPIRAEVCRAFSVLLPLMGDLYGEHWGAILAALANSWTATAGLQENETGINSPIPFVHASLKLYAQLRILTQSEDPNDDLVDAWKETEQTIANGLVNLLKHSQHFPDEFHQPLKMVNDVLARQIAKVPLKHLEDTEDLYPLLYVESQPVQQTAFDILHKQIPAAQEQISIDAALEKTTARLPEELLSLILEAPTVAALADANFERSIPLPLRGYLLSWLLVFDHIQHASFKVKNDYVDHIKEGVYLPGLLDFTFDFLGHAHNKPADISKLDITTYVPDTELPRRDTQWLLTHIYYLCLLHLPALTKSWYIDCKSRPTVVTLEPWTQKFISPPVIAAALHSVQEWADAQEPDDPFSTRIAPRAHEITASYTIDDATMSMRLSLPPAFPLAPARIEGLNRVAVNEQKWQAWLRTSLGAITVFNGSLIDALTTFKRNVEGAIKGQNEHYNRPMTPMDDVKRRRNVQFMTPNTPAPHKAVARL
ncbi:hypothetical protein N0V90_002613 [Kalmusia sp. IMI 367209]|nr:hypothetical protein N0V90_002613 [Kalmusia sp. IMI 367209]